MNPAHLLDRLIGSELPVLRNAADVKAFETTPYEARISVQSTHEALQRGAERDPDAPAIQFLPRADADQEPVVISHARFVLLFAERFEPVQRLHRLADGW